MSRRSLKRLGAFLALAGLLALHLHVLEHVFGWDHDKPGVPCQICQATLALTALEAAPTVEAPEPVSLEFEILQPGPIAFVGSFVRTVEARGPPASA